MAAFIGILVLAAMICFGLPVLAFGSEEAKTVVKGSYVLCMVFGLLGPASHNLGMGLQKWGVDGMSRIKEFFRDGGVRVRVAVWWIGMFLTLGATAFGFLAFGQGITASTLGALGGFGLIVLTLFSFFVLKEEITARELMGILVIVAGTSLMGYFGQSSHGEMLPLDAVYKPGLKLYLIFYTAFWVLGLILSMANVRGLRGVIIGVLAGSMAGCGVTFQRLITTLIDMLLKHRITFLGMITNGYFPPGVLFGLFSVVILQFGFKYGKAVTVVPSYMSALIVFPSIAGMAFLREPVIWQQCLALVVIITGVALISNPKLAEAH